MSPPHIGAPPGHTLHPADKTARCAELARDIVKAGEVEGVKLEALYRHTRGGWIRPRVFVGYRCHLRVLARSGSEVFFIAEGNGTTPFGAVLDALAQPVPYYLYTE